MEKPRNKLRMLICCLVLTFLVTGCWGRRETDELAYILALGIDRGQESVVRVTFQIAIPKALAGGSKGGGEQATEVITVEAASLFGALQLANSFISRELTFLHNEMVVVSAEIAQEGLDKYINPLIRSREIRRNVTIMVTQDSAAEFLKINKPVLEKNPVQQFEVLLNAENYTGSIIDITLNEFNKRVKSPGSNPVLTLAGVNKEGKKQTIVKKDFAESVRTEMDYLPGEVPREGANKIDIIGLAAFRADKLVGYLSGMETRFYQLAAGTFKSAIFSLPDLSHQEDVIVVKVKRGRSPETKVEVSGDKPRITVRIILEGEILSIQSGLNYEAGQKEKELEQYIENFITQEVTKVIKKTQLEFKSDIIGFGEETRRSFWTWQDWVNYKWQEKYPEAEIVVETNLDIRRTGLVLRTEPAAREGLE